MTLNNQQLQELLRQLALTRDAELSCDECLHLVGAYAESELAGRSIDEAMQKVRQHLSVCCDCREEYQVLLEVLRAIGAKGA